MPDFSELEKIRQWIDSLNSAHCQLAHEVISFEDGVAKRRSQGEGFPSILMRVGLCDFESRSRQLSCAHTAARNKLARAIDAMVSYSVLSGAKAVGLKSVLQRIGDDIHQIDMEKSSLEQQYAVLMEKAISQKTSHCDEINAIQYRLGQLRTMHDTAVDQLKDIRRFLREQLEVMCSQ